MRSDVKRRKEVAKELAFEARQLCDCLLAFMDDVEIIMNVSTACSKAHIEKRFANEGIGFLGLTLPRFWTWFSASLEDGKLKQPIPRFTPAKVADRPALLQELTSIVFGPDGSVTVPEDEKALARITKAVELTNTICNSFGKKYEAPLSDQAVDDLLGDLMLTDKTGVLNIDKVYLDLPPTTQRIMTYARMYLVDLFSPFENHEVINGMHTSLVHDFWKMPVIPRFGPGACAEGFDAYGKYGNLFRLPPLKAIRPLSLWHVCSPSPLCPSGIPISVITPRELEYAAGSGRKVKPIVVPKSMGSGRVIIPQENDLMFLQKAYQVNIYDWVESHPLTKGFVNFTDQTINGQLALTSSADRRFATLDLSKASDMVTKGHVGMLFDERMSEMLYLLRNDLITCSVGGKARVWKMNMHAPMGSALCFPVEALVFWAICKAALDVAMLPGDRSVYVYGDDLLVPNDGYEIVSRALSEVGFKVNLKKSYTTGHFRESCGVDAYRGVRVDPTFRISKRFPTVAIEPNERNSSLVAWVEYANLAEAGDYIFLAEAIRRALTQHCPKAKAFPTTGDLRETLEGYLAFYQYGARTVRDRLYRKIQGPLSAIPLRLPSTGGTKPTGFARSLYCEYRISIYVPPFRGAQGTFFGPSVQAPHIRLYVPKSEEVEYAREVEGAPITDSEERTMPDSLAYLRWVLEHSENSHVFPVSKTLDVNRERVFLS